MELPELLNALNRNCPGSYPGPGAICAMPVNRTVGTGAYSEARAGVVLTYTSVQRPWTRE